MYRLTFSAGDVLYKSGDAADTAYLILEGEVRTTRGVVTITNGKGTTIGFSGLFNRPYGSTAIAVSDTAVLVFSRRELKALIYSNPDEAARIIDGMIELFGRVANELERLAEGSGKSDQFD
jgi:cAMP-binding proteins - catabolite gene activator and regulatory subunit of cAMP-dependent protein kinases